jgi:hypothetical protein
MENAMKVLVALDVPAAIAKGRLVSDTHGFIDIDEDGMEVIKQAELTELLGRLVVHGINRGYSDRDNVFSVMDVQSYCPLNVSNRSIKVTELTVEALVVALNNVRKQIEEHAADLNRISDKIEADIYTRHCEYARGINPVPMRIAFVRPSMDGEPVISDYNRPGWIKVQLSNMSSPKSAMSYHQLRGDAKSRMEAWLSDPDGIYQTLVAKNAAADTAEIERARKEAGHQQELTRKQMMTWIADHGSSMLKDMAKEGHELLERHYDKELEEYNRSQFFLRLRNAYEGYSLVSRAARVTPLEDYDQAIWDEFQWERSRYPQVKLVIVKSRPDDDDDDYELQSTIAFCLNIEGCLIAKPVDRDAESWWATNRIENAVSVD